MSKIGNYLKIEKNFGNIRISIGKIEKNFVAMGNYY